MKKEKQESEGERFRMGLCFSFGKTRTCEQQHRMQIEFENERQTLRPTNIIQTICLAKDIASRPEYCITPTP